MENNKYKKANEIIEGSRFPNEEELRGMDQFLKYQEKQEKNDALEANPIPFYWKNVLINCPLLGNLLYKLIFLTKFKIMK